MLYGRDMQFATDDGDATKDDDAERASADYSDNQAIMDVTPEAVAALTSKYGEGGWVLCRCCLAVMPAPRRRPVSRYYSASRLANTAPQIRLKEGCYLCPNCIRRPVDCVLNGAFNADLAANFICRVSGASFREGFLPTCRIGHLAKYCPLAEIGETCPYCVEPGSNCSACALARARPMINEAAVNSTHSGKKQAFDGVRRACLHCRCALMIDAGSCDSG